ncbi:MAG: glycosyl hydrolase [Bacteroidales bacterium]
MSKYIFFVIFAFFASLGLNAQTNRIKASLVVNKPTAETINLYNFLLHQYGKKLASSTMANVDWDTNEALWLEYHTTELPAMVGLDYIHMMLSEEMVDYSDTKFVEEWVEKGGFVNITWHWNTPIAKGSGDKEFYADKNDFSPKRALQKGTWENDFVNSDLEKVANYLLLLKEQNIPVIWRPLHEAAGNIYEFEGGSAWFWWGTEGGVVYKDLWQYMFDYFESQGLNNLIWVWTTQTKDDDFYPGDKYVDIIGRDIYDNHDAEDIAKQFREIQSTYNNKMLALSECGNVAKISEQWAAGAKWSFFMPWYDYRRTKDLKSKNFKKREHKFCDIDWWEDVISCQFVLMLDDLSEQ